MHKFVTILLKHRLLLSIRAPKWLKFLANVAFFSSVGVGGGGGGLVGPGGAIPPPLSMLKNPLNFLEKIMTH